MIRPVVFGKFVLLERISVGGMAEVYRAKLLDFPQFDRFLAIKRILPNLAADEEFLSMFIDEAKITVELNHPNICQIYELGRLGKAHYIAMEYIPGRGVLAIQNFYRKQRKIMSVSQASFITAQVAQGLDYAHKATDQNGNPLHLIHRDVSPQNLLISFEGVVKLIDFGIAKAATKNSKTQSGVLKGKFGYMSPEQATGAHIDHRSDIFALGTIFWEMLTGRRLFHADSEYAIIEQIEDCKIEAPSKYNRSIPPEVDKIALRALEKNPIDRFQWASEMQQALSDFINSCSPPFTQWHLQNWMCTNFSEDLEKEWEKLPIFNAINTVEDVDNFNKEKIDQLNQEITNSQWLNETPTTDLDYEGNPIPEIQEVRNSTDLEELYAPSFDFSKSQEIQEQKESETSKDQPQLPQIPGRLNRSLKSKSEEIIPEHLKSIIMPLSTIEELTEDSSNALQALDIEKKRISSIQKQHSSKRTRIILLSVIFSLLLLIVLTLLFLKFGQIQDFNSSQPISKFARLDINILPINPQTQVILHNASNPNEPISNENCLLGKTDCFFDNLEFGRYFLEVTQPNFETEKFTLQINNPKNIARVELSKPLEEIKKLQITLPDANAQLYLNNTLVEGKGKQRVVSISAGIDHTLTLKKAGYKTINLTINTNSANIPEFVLEKAYPVVTVLSIPTRAKIWKIDNQNKKILLGNTPLKITNLDSENTLNLEVHKSGYKVWKHSMNFSDDFDIKLFGLLQKE